MTVGIMRLLEPAIDTEINASWTAWGWQENDWREQDESARQKRKRLQKLVDCIMYVGDNGGNDRDIMVGISNLLKLAIDAELTVSWTAWGWQPA